MKTIHSETPPVITNCGSCGGSRNHGEYCAYCGALYPENFAPEAPRKKLTSLGSKYRVDKTPNGLKISWRWWSVAHLFLIPFALFWNSIAFSLGDWRILLSDPVSLFPIPLIHMLIGIGLPVYVAISFLNKTTIRADRRSLSIEHFPIPIGRSLDIATSEIQQIFVSKGQRSNKHNSWNVPILQLVTSTGERFELMKGKSEVEFSDYEALRQNVLDSLGIAPAPAMGAIDG